MRTALSAILLLASTAALASDGIVPTSDPGSDCVAATIVVQRTEHHRKYDEMYCAANKDRPAYENCLLNLGKHKSIPFFTDRCNDRDAGAYVSFNGESHQVWRQAQKPHPDVRYAGTYKAEKVLVRVQPRKLIKRFKGGGVTYAVDVLIESDGKAVTIPATYDSRH